MQSEFKPLKNPARVALIVAGSLALVLGIVGAFVPILPTTPFVLLAAMCYVRSSQRLYERLMRSRFAGKHAQNVLAGKGIPLVVKIFSLAVSAIMIGYVSIIVTESFFVRLLLGTLFAVQLLFMIRIATLRSEQSVEESEIEKQELGKVTGKHRRCCVIRKHP